MQFEKMNTPHIIQFPKIGRTIEGYISVAEGANLPFEVKRVYWTYFTPENISRGGHAHRQLEQILVAVSGTIVVTTQMPGQSEKSFILDSADKGLYIPRRCWRTMKYRHNSVQICIASMVYEESDYIRDYEAFLKLSEAVATHA